jgi:2-keto-4-pentenoate hydratase
MDAAMLTAANVGARLGVLGQRTPVKANRKFADALAAMRISLSDETGEVLGKAQGLVILDHPLNAVLWLVEELNQAGITLKPGDMLSLGSVMMMTPAPVGKAITVRYEGLPGDPIKVSVRFKAR